MGKISFVKIMLFIMSTFFVVFIVFKDEIIKSGYFQQFKLVNITVIIIGFLSVFFYYVSKYKKTKKDE